jgi:hypothetical protein
MIDLLQALALCERRSPDMELGPQAAPFPVQQDVEGALIAVRPWNGAEMPGAENPTLLFDTTAFAGTSHVV